MNRSIALERLELEEPVAAAEIDAQYQELYNEFQMRITNAPTEHQRKLYQKKLEELKEARNLLNGAQTHDDDLPQTGPSQTRAFVQAPVEQKTSEKPAGSGDQFQNSLKVLGLTQMPSSAEALQKAFDQNYASLSTALTSDRESIQKVAKEELRELEKAFNFLEAHIKTRRHDNTRPATHKVVNEEKRSEPERVKEPPIIPRQAKREGAAAGKRLKTPFFLPFAEASGNKLKITIFISVMIPVLIFWAFNFPESGGDPVFPDYDQMEKHWLFANTFLSVWLSYIGFFVWHIVRQKVVRNLFSIPMVIGIMLSWASTKDYTEEFDIPGILSLPFYLYASLVSLAILIYILIFWIKYILKMTGR